LKPPPTLILKRTGQYLVISAFGQPLMKFISPLLLNDMETLASPVSYISYQVKSTDDKTHNVKVYLGASSFDISVNIL